MAAIWVVTYVALWVLVLALGFVVVGLLQQVGMLNAQLSRTAAEEKVREAANVPISEDGPPIGSTLDHLQSESVNGFGMVDLPATDSGRAGTLLLLLSAMCESCQQLVEPLNTFVAEQAERTDRVDVVAILRADEYGGHAFLSVFPLNVAVILDRD